MTANKTYVDLQLPQKTSIGYVDNNVVEGIAGVVNTAPLALDTLKERAAALNNDNNSATYVQTQFTCKADKTTTHTRTETSGLLDFKADQTDMDFKATASTIYTTSEINNLFSQKASVSDV